MSDFQLGPGPLMPEFEQVKSDIGIVENGDTATHAIPKGYYVIWKGDLYVAKSDISSGTTLSSSNLTAKTSGIGADLAALNSNLIWEEVANIPYSDMGEYFNGSNSSCIICVNKATKTAYVDTWAYTKVAVPAHVNVEVVPASKFPDTYKPKYFNAYCSAYAETAYITMTSYYCVIMRSDKTMRIVPNEQIPKDVWIHCVFMYPY